MKNEKEVIFIEKKLFLNKSRKAKVEKFVPFHFLVDRYDEPIVMEEKKNQPMNFSISL